jgi:hypothetical protein
VLVAACSSDEAPRRATAEPVLTPAATAGAALQLPPATSTPAAVPAPASTIAPAPPPPAATAPPPAPTARPAAAPGAPPANLSDRLQRIVALYDAGQLAPTLAGISGQVDLPATGASSLSGTPDGRLLVQVRLQGRDTSAIQALGEVVNSAPDFSTITVAIEASRLRALAALPAVLSARELIRPSTGADTGR